MAPRPRRKATAQQLAASFTVLAKALGLSFYTYNDESNHVDRAKLGNNGPGASFEDCNIEANRAVRQCGAGNVTVPTKTMDDALRPVAARCQKEFQLFQAEVDDIMSGRRIRNLVTVTAQALVSSPHAPRNTSAPSPGCYGEKGDEDEVVRGWATHNLLRGVKLAAVMRDTCGSVSELVQQLHPPGRVRGEGQLHARLFGARAAGIHRDVGQG